MPPKKRATVNMAEQVKDTPEPDADSVTMTKTALAELLSEGEKAAYERGHAAGVAEAKKPPLFEACKLVTERYWATQTDQQIVERFAEVEADYGEKLTFADQELILGAARRYRMADRASEMAVAELTRPRKQPPRGVVVEQEITV